MLDDWPYGRTVTNLARDMAEPLGEAPLGETLMALNDDAGPSPLRSLQAAALGMEASVPVILTPIARLWVSWHQVIAELERGYPAAPGRQTVADEIRWVSERADRPAQEVMADLIRDRILVRHLHVAARKLQKQGRNTFLVELESGRLMPRATRAVEASGPRLGTAVQFLEDVGLLSGGLLTDLGREWIAE